MRGGTAVLLVACVALLGGGAASAQSACTAESQHLSELVSNMTNLIDAELAKEQEELNTFLASREAARDALSQRVTRETARVNTLTMSVTQAQLKLSELHKAIGKIGAERAETQTATTDATAECTRTESALNAQLASLQRLVDVVSRVSSLLREARSAPEEQDTQELFETLSVVLPESAVHSAVSRDSLLKLQTMIETGRDEDSDVVGSVSELIVDIARQTNQSKIHVEAQLRTNAKDCKERMESLNAQAKALVTEEERTRTEAESAQTQLAVLEKEANIASADLALVRDALEQKDQVVSQMVAVVHERRKVYKQQVLAFQNLAAQKMCCMCSA